VKIFTNKEAVLSDVILSGFADEGPVSKRAEEQFTMMRALGLSYYTIRFVDLGNGIKNVMQLTKTEVKQLLKLHKEFGMSVSSLGSPLGKVKLLDVDDGTKNRYVPLKKYLDTEVNRAIELAHAFDTKLIRGFSYYHPAGSDPWTHLNQASDQLGEIVARCAKAGLIYGSEVESDLIGGDGETLIAMHKRINSPNTCIIMDVGNMEYKGHSPESVFAQYLKTKPGLGWIHIKGYNAPEKRSMITRAKQRGLTRFIPVDQGDAGHEMVLRDFKTLVPKLDRQFKKMGVPGVFVDLEPHVKGGGQFGGFSGVDGFGVALRSLCNLLDYLGYSYHLSGYEDLTNP
jgi:sugar phosphate isomerase/epimerase